MKRKHIILFLLTITNISHITLLCTPKGPINPEWFYDTQNPFATANTYHQKQQWINAADEYEKLLQQHVGTEYDQSMARLNLAACLMAQRKESIHWSTFDTLLEIPIHQRISSEIIKKDESKSILIKTNDVGIGDIFHFFSAANILKQRTNWNITLSVPQFLKPTLQDAAKKYNLTIIGTFDTPPSVDYQSHLIALLGHLNLKPTDLKPETVVFTPPSDAINRVMEQIATILEDKNKHLIVVDRGEVNRQAILIGGKKLPYNTNEHGRHLDSEPFKQLLMKYPNTVLLDCGKKNSRVEISDNQKDRYLIIPDEKQAFDTIIALAHIMSMYKNIFGFGPDMGQTNVFIRSLDTDAQNRMAIIIPNSEEHDMRMSGDGEIYQHMISDCQVYKCEKPSDQTKVIEQAYKNMTQHQ